MLKRFSCTATATFYIVGNSTAMYEHKRRPLAPVHIFYKRIFKNILIANLVIVICLMIGMTGYHYTANIPWLDALHNASMILSGMGPVVEINSVSG